MLQVNNFLKKVIILSFMPFCLAYCVKTKRVNYIVPGEYYGKDHRDRSIACKLVINPITEEEYIKADGLNVIFDLVKGGCYSLTFTATYEDGEIRTFNFKNFEDWANGLDAYSIIYVDENGTRFCPSLAGRDDKPFYDLEIPNPESEEYFILTELRAK